MKKKKEFTKGEFLIAALFGFLVGMAFMLFVIAALYDNGFQSESEGSPIPIPVKTSVLSCNEIYGGILKNWNFCTSSQEFISPIQSCKGTTISTEEIVDEYLGQCKKNKLYK